MRSLSSVPIKKPKAHRATLYTLDITYNLPNGGRDAALDRDLTAVARKHGWKWLGQGFRFKTKARDIGFIRKD
jgi:hypothetical protein